MILLFHSYMRIDGGLIADGTVAYRSIIEKNPNVKLVLAGHTRGVGRRTDSFDDDGDGTPERTVEEIVMNYQNIKRGGQGYLVIMSFDPDDGSIAFTAYSPYLDDVGWYGDGRDVFTLENVW